ncbi:MAG: YhcH/YjgK/YiaL family protein [Lachnospiraceae bacterium]|nr:YhcH/YjgK/YiaL family protein [Lachnospiraceae bacterium]
MLTTGIAFADKYDYLSEKFQKVYAFLRETDLASLPLGTIHLDGDDIYAMVQGYTTMGPDECRFESHKNYFDLQYVVEGEELFGYAPADTLEPATEYDAERDVLFYKEPEKSGMVNLKPGDFAIVAPEDGHAPRRMTANGPCEIKKIVVKIKI